MSSQLKLTDITKKFEANTVNEKVALDHLNLTVEPGQFVTVLGSNGSGKSTMFNVILGSLFPDEGKVYLGDKDITKLKDYKRALNIGCLYQNPLRGTAPNLTIEEKLDTICKKIYHANGVQLTANAVKQAKQRVGVVFDTCSFPEEMTVASVGKLMSYSYDSWSPADFEQRLAQFQLPKSKTVKDLSRGMSMKLSLACALAHDPDLLILDEATAGLDPLAREEALDILRGYMRDERHGILMSSHITSDLEKIADYIVCIDAGRIVFAVEKDTITDLAGIAHCRATDYPGELRSMRHPYGIDVLAPDRFAFAENFKNIAVDKADIDVYMGMMLKGEVR